MVINIANEFSSEELRYHVESHISFTSPLKIVGVIVRGSGQSVKFSSHRFNEKGES